MAKALKQENEKALKGVGKALLLISLAAGAFYLGSALFAMRNSQTMVCLTVPSEEGLLVYRYQGLIEQPVSDNDTDDSEGRLWQNPDYDTDWTYIELSEKVRLLGDSGKVDMLDEIYGESFEKSIVEITVGPDGKISKISKVPGVFSVEGEIEEKQDDVVTVSKNQYVVAEEVAFDGEEGDLAKLYGFDDTIIFAEVLERAGFVEVAADVEGARVFLDGVYKGKAPVSFKAVPGLREVMVKSEGYETTKTKVLIQSQTDSQVRVELPLIVGTVAITSAPSNAEVYINQESEGKTPLEIELSPGDYDVLIEMPGYYSKKSRFRMQKDAQIPLHFDLVEETSGISPIGGLTPKLPTPGGHEDSENESGVKATILSFEPDTLNLKAVDSRQNLISISVPQDVPLETLPYGRTTWDSLFPGEQIIMNVSSSGDLEKAIKVYSHNFSASGRVFGKDGRHITVGDNWTRCTLNPDALVRHKGENTFSGTLEIGDTVTVYGTSANDIKYVCIEDTLGEKSSFEGHLVRTKDGPRVFGDSAQLWIEVPDNLDVVDSYSQQKDKVARVASGSRLRFYVNPKGNIVWAEYVWKADLSIEGNIALLTGPVISIIPSWEDVAISQNTIVFLNRNRRSFYDVKLGDTVLVAGPSAADARFIWIQDRLAFDTVVEGFMGAAGGRQGRVFYQLERSGKTTPWIVDTDVAFTYPARRQSLLPKEVNRGDKVRLWVGAGGKPVWGEVVERNQINLKGHYLGESGGLMYFSGFRGFAPAKNMTVVGLFGSDELEKGSQVCVGGYGQSVNFIEVQALCEPKRRAYGTVVSVERNSIKILQSRYYVTEYDLSGDTWYVDWDARVDGSAHQLDCGDKVSIAIGAEREALFFERDYSPRFRVDGTITRISGRDLTISGDYGTLRVSVERNAIVYKNRELSGYRALQKGDKVKISGPSANRIELVIEGS